MVTMRNVFTVVLAAACLAVLTARVPVEFSRIRYRAVTTARPALYDPSVTIHLPDISRARRLAVGDRGPIAGRR